MTRSDIAKRIYAHAEAHYDEGGWDVIVECHDPASIEELVWDRGDEVEDTFEAAMIEIEAVVSIWADRQADAFNSAF